MATMTGVMVRAALSRASRWKRISSAFSKTSKLFDAEARRGGASGRMALGRRARSPPGGFCGAFQCSAAGYFILTYDATIGGAQYTAYG